MLNANIFVLHADPVSEPVALNTNERTTCKLFLRYTGTHYDWLRPINGKDTNEELSQQFVKYMNGIGAGGRRGGDAAQSTDEEFMRALPRRRKRAKFVSLSPSGRRGEPAPASDGSMSQDAGPVQTAKATSPARVITPAEWLAMPASAEMTHEGKVGEKGGGEARASTYCPPPAEKEAAEESPTRKL